jgi:hypothetical protein
VAKERAADFKKWKSPALFLSPETNAHGDGRLNPKVINTVYITHRCHKREFMLKFDAVPKLGDSPGCRPGEIGFAPVK